MTDDGNMTALELKKRQEIILQSLEPLVARWKKLEDAALEPTIKRIEDLIKNNKK